MFKFTKLDAKITNNAHEDVVMAEEKISQKTGMFTVYLPIGTENVI